MKWLWNGSFRVLFVVLFVFSFAHMGWAGSKLLQVHKQALAQYQQDHDPTKAFIALQLAGIKQAIDKQPADMSTPDYVHLLNDFAFFRYESTAFKENVPITVHHKDLTYVGNERMQRYDDIPNATMRLNRLCEARQILEKVIELAPDRTVAYLNLGDVYWRMAQYSQKLTAYNGSKNVKPLLHKVGDLDADYKLIPHVKPGFENFFRAYDTYQRYRDKMVAQGKAEQIPERISHLLGRNTYAVLDQDDNIQRGDYRLCEDYEEAMNLLPDGELSPLDGPRGDIGQYDKRFKRLNFSSFSPEMQKRMRWGLYLEQGSRDPYLVYEHNGEIYIDLRDGRLLMITESQVRLGVTATRCGYSVLDFKRHLVKSW